MRVKALVSVQAELEHIRQQDPEGILRPEAVVKFAEDPETKLHERFTWDDGEAAEQFRLWEARQIIRVTVNVIADDMPPVRVYGSLYSDREETAGGYRRVRDILEDPVKREEYLQQALNEANAFRSRYARLRELAAIFEAIGETRKKLSWDPRKRRKPK